MKNDINKRIAQRRKDISRYLAKEAAKKIKAGDLKMYHLQLAIKREGTTGLPNVTNVQGVLQDNRDYNINTFLGVLLALDLNLAIVDNDGKLVA